MSKLRSIKIVSIGLLLAMLAVNCDWANPQVPSAESDGAGNNKNGKTSPGPSTEEPARKIEELAQKPADNHQEYAAKLANLSEQGEEPATSSQEVPEQTQKSSLDEAVTKVEAATVDRRVQGLARSKLPTRHKEDPNNDTGVLAGSRPELEQTLKSSADVTELQEQEKVADQEPASPDLRTEEHEEDPNNDTGVLAGSRPELEQTLKSSADVTELQEQEKVADQEPASPDLSTETREKDPNNDTEVLEEEVTGLNERLSDAEQEVSKAEEVIQKIAQGIEKSNFLKKESKQELKRLKKVLDDSESKLAADAQLIAELQEKDNKSSVRTATQKMNKLKRKVKKLKSDISGILKNDKNKRDWK